ncbi:MAG: hypothetical protein ACRKGH_05025 [Dehalogenimonas sp.]
MKIRWFFPIVIVMLGLFMAGCAAGPNALTGIPATDGEIAGFWIGLWHGFISPITFIISLFSDNVNIYEVYNNGGWYNFGFLFGASIILGGGAKGASGRKSG